MPDLTRAQVDRGSFTVVGERTDGTIGPIDVLDLDESSFRRWVMAMLIRSGVQPDAEQLTVRPYRQGLPVGHPALRR